jgi:hypothetical protein
MGLSLSEFRFIQAYPGTTQLSGKYGNPINPVRVRPPSLTKPQL